jgi:DNA polymerase-3 subunit delta
MGQASNIIEEIKKGKIASVYLIYGEETYFIENTISELIDALAPKSARDFNLDVFSTPDISVDEIIAAADTYPVMAERRVVVVKNPGFLSSKKETGKLEYFLESRELYRSNNLTRSALLLAKAIDIDLGDFAESGAIFTKAIQDFKAEYEDDLTSDDIEFLNDDAQSLASEIDVFSASPKSSGIDRLLEWLQSRPEAFCVLVIAVNSALSSNNPLVKVISKVGKAVSFGKLRQASYVKYDPMYQLVNDKLSESGKTISADAFSELQKKTGNNMGQIFDELNKLLTFIGVRRQIEKNDVEDLVTKSDVEGIFDLTRAVGQRSLPLALANLRSIMKKGDHPLLIHTMLTRQIRFLLQVKLLMEKGWLKQDLSNMNYDSFQQQVIKKLPPEVIAILPEAKQSNILKQPYPLYITAQQAKNFTIEELMKAMERLLEADIQLKSGTLTPELVVEMLVVDLCSSKRNPSAKN